MIKTFQTAMAPPAKSSGGKGGGISMGTILVFAGIGLAIYLGYRHIQNQNPVQPYQED